MTSKPTKPPVRARGKFIRTVESAKRDAEAARLRSRGRTYPQIAEELGYSDRGAAHHAVARVFDGFKVEARDLLIKMELDKLDMMTRAVIDVLEAKHYTVSDGRIVHIGDKDDPDRRVLDDGPVLQAVDRLLKISDRRAKLLGLDAPKRVEVSDTTPDLDAAVRDLAAELAAAGRGTQVPQE
ncbi:MAG: hypothetical protein ACR2KO_15845 [Geodermatophilaceae bacterium]